jgi:hypothetical protein
VLPFVCRNSTSRPPIWGNTSTGEFPASMKKSSLV